MCRPEAYFSVTRLRGGRRFGEPTIILTVSQTALISGTVNWFEFSLSVGDRTPPEEQILTWSAPIIINFLVVLRHASTSRDHDRS